MTRSQFRGAEDHFNKFELHVIFNEANYAGERAQPRIDGNKGVRKKRFALNMKKYSAKGCAADEKLILLTTHIAYFPGAVTFDAFAFSHQLFYAHL